MNDDERDKLRAAVKKIRKGNADSLRAYMLLLEHTRKLELGVALMWAAIGIFGLTQVIVSHWAYAFVLVLATWGAANKATSGIRVRLALRELKEIAAKLPADTPEAGDDH